MIPSGGAILSTSVGVLGQRRAGAGGPVGDKRMKRCAVWAWAVCLMVFASVPAMAHPHIFINNTMTVIFDRQKLSGITFRWVFDPMFSATLFADFTPDSEGQFSPSAIKQIKTGDFDNLVNYHYFLVFMLGRKRLSHIDIQQFTPSVVNHSNLVYSFFVPLNLSVLPEEQTLRVTVYDDTYLVAFDLMHTTDIAVKGDQTVETVWSIEKSRVRPMWPGQYMPDNLVIRFKEKK